MSDAIKAAESMREAAGKVADSSSRHHEAKYSETDDRAVQQFHLAGASVSSKIARAIRALPLPEAKPDPPDDALVKAREALAKIAKWHGEFPSTGYFWPSGGAISYEAQWGSDGARDFMREIARSALAALDAAKGAE